MTKNEIISEFYLSREFKSCINKLAPYHLRDDLKSEVMLVLCQEEEWFIQQLHSQDELKYWAAKIVMNMVKSNNSTFYTMYRCVPLQLKPGFDVMDEPEDVDLRIKRENAEEAALDEINQLHWYNADLIKLYCKLGSFRKVSNITGFPFQTVHRAIAAGCMQIKNKML